MTRKDIELIARTVNETFDAARERGTIVTRYAMARAFTNALDATNSEFDRVQFMTACGAQTK